MSDKRGRALTYAALISIKAALNEAQSPADFLAEADAILAKPASLLELPFDTDEPEPLDPGGENQSGRDVDNAPRVYEFLGELDRANASDRRLWTYLAFVTYREYMTARWPLDGVKNWKNRVETRWLMLNATRGRLVRHGVSRLWWIASLTYDPHLEHSLTKASGDRFAYTRAALRNEDRVLGLFDREAGALPGLVRTVLEHASVGGARATDDHLRALMKELTLVYGYRDLAALDADTLATLVSESAPEVAAAFQP
jgi:hypothetical protein